jgi:hypothetical protein
MPSPEHDVPGATLGLANVSPGHSIWTVDRLTTAPPGMSQCCEGGHPGAWQAPTTMPARFEV